MKLDITNSETGEFVFEDIELQKLLELVEEKEKSNYAIKIKSIVTKYERDKYSLTLEELEFMMKVKKISKNIKLDFREDGYYSVKKDMTYSELNIKTLGFLFLAGANMSNEGRLVKGGKTPIKTYKDITSYFGIEQNDWNRYIIKDVKKFNLIRKERINGSVYLLVNPIYLFKDRTITETSFITFHDEIKKHIHDLEYIYLCRRYNIIPE